MKSPLIKDHWYAVLEATEVPKGKPFGARRLGMDLVFWRGSDGEVICMRDSCPHRNASFIRGKVENGTLACPFHGFQFGADGRCVHMPSIGDGRIPANYGIATLVVREAHGFIWLWHGDRRTELPELPWFDHIDDSYIWATNRSEWNCHFAIVLEASFDPAHGPFVHRRSLGRFIHPIQKPIVEQTEEPLYTTIQQGSPLKKLENFFLSIGFPNVLLSQQARGLLLLWVAAPVDENRTVVYFRNYQNKVRLPLLGKLVCLVQAMGNKVLVAEDLPVLEHIREEWDPWTKNQRLVAADSMLAAYRSLWRRRAKQLEASSNRALPQHDATNPL